MRAFEYSWFHFRVQPVSDKKHCRANLWEFGYQGRYEPIQVHSYHLPALKSLSFTIFNRNPLSDPWLNFPEKSYVSCLHLWQKCWTFPRSSWWFNVRNDATMSVMCKLVVVAIWGFLELLYFSQYRRNYENWCIRTSWIVVPPMLLLMSSWWLYSHVPTHKRPTMHYEQQPAAYRLFFYLLGDLKDGSFYHHLPSICWVPKPK